jgi:hypothetical protein
VVVCWAAGLTASAQTQPIPVLPPPSEPPPSAGPAPPGGAPAPTPQTVVRPTRPPPWDYSLGVGAWWESNAGFDPGPVPNDVSGAGRAFLARRFEGPQSQVVLALGGSGYAYRDLSQYNRVDGDASLDGRWQLSSRASATLQGLFEYGHTDSASILTEQGVLLPLQRTQSYSATAGLATRASPNTSLRLRGRFYRVAFGAPQAEQAVTPVDSDSLRADAAIERRLSEWDRFSVEYAFEAARGDVRADSHYGSLGWTHTFSPRTAVFVDGGASYTVDAANAGLPQSWNFYGGVSLNRQVRRSTVKAYYRREVIPVFGFAGLRLTDRLGLDASTTMGEDWSLVLTAQYVVGPKEEADSSRPTAGDAGLSLAWHVSRHVSLSAEGRYRRRSASAVPGADDFTAGLILSLASSPGSVARVYAPSR